METSNDQKSMETNKDQTGERLSLSTICYFIK